jgi:RNA polymerase sigma factor (sigma-70 family)
MTAKTKEEIVKLVYQVRDGNNRAFEELERIAKPLLVSLSNRFANYHYRFEFEDFYMIALNAMYRACFEYDERNPSFLDFAKVFIFNRCSSEIEYWNQGKRNIFDNDEVEFDNLHGHAYSDDMVDTIFINDFRSQVIEIIDENFDETKAKVLKLHILEDKKVVDIANELGLQYKNVYSVIQRGTKKIINKYAEKHIYSLT